MPTRHWDPRPGYERDSRVRAFAAAEAEAKQGAWKGLARSASEIQVEEEEAKQAAWKKTRGSLVRAFATAKAHVFVYLKGKIKILTTYAQMLALFGLAFRIDWPDEYEETQENVNMIANFSPIGPIAAACMMGRRWTFLDTLLLKTLFPTILILLMELPAAVMRKCKWAVSASAFEAMSSTIVFLLFPSVCSVLFAAFNKSSFDQGGGAPKRYFLTNDLLIEWGGSNWIAEAEPLRSYQIYAIVMMAVWPLGVPLQIAFKFWGNRKGVHALVNAQSREEGKLELIRIAEEDQRELERSQGAHVESCKYSVGTRLNHDARGTGTAVEIKGDGTLVVRFDSGEAHSYKPSSQFKLRRIAPRDFQAERDAAQAQRIFEATRARALLKDPMWINSRLEQYEERTYYYDLVEVLRKLLLAGVATIFNPGTVEQLLLGVLVTVIFLCITFQLKPYKVDSDDSLATWCSGALLVTLLGAVWLRSEQTVRNFMVSGGDEEERDAAMANYNAYKQDLGVALMVLGAAPAAYALFAFLFEDMGVARHCARRCRGKRQRTTLGGDADLLENTEGEDAKVEAHLEAMQAERAGETTAADAVIASEVKEARRRHHHRRKSGAPRPRNWASTEELGTPPPGGSGSGSPGPYGFGNEEPDPSIVLSWGASRKKSRKKSGGHGHGHRHHGNGHHNGDGKSATAGTEFMA